MQFQFSVDETPNTAPCAYPSTTPCADKIFFQNGGFDYTKSFTINNANYTLQLLGFKETQYSGSTPVTYFISQVLPNSSPTYLTIKGESALYRISLWTI